MLLNFNTLLKLRGFPVDKAKEIKRLIPSNHYLIDWQERKKWEIFDFHIKQNPVYHSFIKTFPKSWADIPIITKKELQINTFINKYDISSRLYIRNTSGSTGTPLTYALDYQSHALTWLHIEDRYKELGISLNDKQARFYGTPLNHKERWKERFKDTISNRYRFSLLDLSDKALDNWINIFIKKSFKYMYGYSFPIITFSKYLLKKGLILNEVCPSLNAVIVTAEMCPHIEQKTIEQATGVKVANEYGASEIGIIGFGTANQWIVSDELVYVEIVDENGKLLPEGKLGRIICTPLFNQGTPFIRYDVGDLGSIKTTKEGRILTNLEGRREEIMLLPSGKKLPGDTFFYYIMKDFATRVKDLSEYRVIQKTTSSFEILLVANKPIQSKETIYLEKIIAQKTNEEINISIVYVDAIERTKMGKFRRFISEL